MKALMIGLMICSCAFVAQGDVFQMDRKGDAIVEVEKSGGEYRIVCKFKPQTRFDKAVNAKFNDAKGDSLCKKGLARYLKVATNETLVVSGQYSVVPMETVGERLCYSFGVPISGCKVAKVEPKPPKAVVPESSMMGAAKAPQAITNIVPVQKSPEVMPKAPVSSNTAQVVRSTAYVCVARYKEVNGMRTAVSRKEYSGRNFKNRKEFDQFCQQEFARIRAQGEANLRAVRNFGK